MLTIPVCTTVGSSAFLGARRDIGRVNRSSADVRIVAPVSLPSATRRQSLQVQATQAGGSNGRVSNGQVSNGNKVGVTVRNTSNRKPVAKPNSETFKISGRTVVITGGSQGCGRATALLFAKKGSAPPHPSLPHSLSLPLSSISFPLPILRWLRFRFFLPTCCRFNVIIAARDETKCMYTAEDCAKIAGRQGAALAIPTDVTSEMSVKRLANEVLSRYGTIDVVVSNAGYCMSGPFADTKLDDFKSLMDINFYVSRLVPAIPLLLVDTFVPSARLLTLFLVLNALQGTVNLAREFMPVLKMSGKVKSLTKPSFVVVNSIGGVLPVKNMSAYCASKHALAGFSECLRLEAEAMGVHVGQVHPGVVNSDFMASAEFKGNAAAQTRKQMSQMLRTPVAQTPEDIANAVWDCATGEADHPSPLSSNPKKFIPELM